MKKIQNCLLITAIAVLFNSCAKDGATGPAGPTGPAGATGSANVTATTFSIFSWSQSSFWYSILSVPAITTTVNNSGTVQVFFSVSNGTNWVALPFTVVSSTDYFFEYWAGVNTVQVEWLYNGAGSGTDPNTFLGTTVQIKVVVIPPAMRKHGIDNTNWVAVKNAYNLND
jgi:hypothetical protein